MTEQKAVKICSPLSCLSHQTSPHLPTLGESTCKSSRTLLKLLQEVLWVELCSLQLHVVFLGSQTVTSLGGGVFTEVIELKWHHWRGERSTNVWCPYRRREFGHRDRHAQRKDDFSPAPLRDGEFLSFEPVRLWCLGSPGKRTQRGFWYLKRGIFLYTTSRAVSQLCRLPGSP